MDAVSLGVVAFGAVLLCVAVGGALWFPLDARSEELASEPLLYRTKTVEDFAGSLVKTTEEFKLDPATNNFVLSTRTQTILQPTVITAGTGSVQVMLQPTLGGQVIVRDYGKERADYEVLRDAKRIEAAMRAGFTLNEARANLGLPLVDNDGRVVGIAVTQAPESAVQVLKPFVAPSRKRAPVSVEETP